MMFGFVKENMINSTSYKILKAAFLTGCFFFAACENDPKLIEAMTNNKVMVEEGKNIETLISEGSRIKAKLKSPYMLRYVADTVYDEFPKTLKVDFYDADGKINRTWGKSKSL